MADTKEYKLVGENHAGAEKGDVVELSESQYEAFEDKFEPVQNNDESDESDEGDDGEEEYPVHKGGGHYELSNGETVEGKEDAIEAQAELDGE